MSNNNLVVKELPSIEYDRELLVPEVIERKKWNIIYIWLAIFWVMLSIVFSFAVKLVESKKQEVAAEIIAYCDSKPKIEKLKSIWQNLNIPNMLISQFMLENLFFVDVKNFEIVNSFKSFFNAPEVQWLVWSFKISSINLSNEGGWKEEITKIPLKIEWTFSSFTDLSNMISILNKMIPVIVIERIEFSKWNNVLFKWFLYNFNKKIFTYDYGQKYQEINEILKNKEIYQKDKIILRELLKDKDLWLEKMWVTEIYDCKQYEDILKINKLTDFKKKEIETCKDVEVLINNNQALLNKKFEAFIKKAWTTEKIGIFLPEIDYSQSDLGIKCSDYWIMSLEWWNPEQPVAATSTETQ